MLRIFSFDDCSTVRQVLLAAQAGWGAVGPSDSWSGLSRPLLGAGVGSVLVCELERPGIDGAAFYRIAQRFNRSLRIAILTARPERAPQGLADCVTPKRGGAAAPRAWLSQLGATAAD